MVGRPEGRGEQGQRREHPRPEPGAQRASRARSPSSTASAADEVGRPQHRRDRRRSQRDRQERPGAHPARGEVGLRGVRGRGADEEEQGDRDTHAERVAPAQPRCHGRQPRRTRASHTSRYWPARCSWPAPVGAAHPVLQLARHLEHGEAGAQHVDGQRGLHAPAAGEGVAAANAAGLRQRIPDSGWTGAEAGEALDAAARQPTTRPRPRRR